jgi:transcriptional regulator with XRE-family HTH domain
MSTLAPGRNVFSALLRRSRQDSGLSQAELARRSGLSVRAIAYMEAGRTTRPYPSSVRSLADALGLSDLSRSLLLQVSRPAGSDREPTFGEPSAAGGSTDGIRASRTAAFCGRPLLGVIPRHLPVPVRHFVGRTSQLAALDEQLPRHSDDHPAVSVICGAAGAGKTALAVCWAHQAARHFPDGQLSLNLGGSDVRGPLTSAQGAAALLESLHVPAGQIPASLDARVGLLRSLLAGHRMLVLLDDARDCEQARPLVSASSGCMTLITSRDLLLGLVAAEGASLVLVGRLSDSEARALLTQRLGQQRIGCDPGAFERLLASCAGSASALAAVAAVAAAEPTSTLSRIASQVPDNAGLHGVGFTD